MAWRIESDGTSRPATIEEQRELCDPIAIPDSQNLQQIPINQKKTREVHRTLGCTKSIDGIKSGQVKQLSKHRITLGNRIKNDRDLTGNKHDKHITPFI
jgi:hypothetical protein